MFSRGPAGLSTPLTLGKYQANPRPFRAVEAKKLSWPLKISWFWVALKGPLCWPWTSLGFGLICEYRSIPPTLQSIQNLLKISNIWWISFQLILTIISVCKFVRSNDCTWPSELKIKKVYSRKFTLNVNTLLCVF